MSAVRDFVPNIYHGMTNDVYHASPGISNSGLGNIAQSPMHYYARHLDPLRPAPTERAGQLEGSLAHCAILEPDELDKRYAVGPTANRNTKIWKEFVAAHPQQVCIQADQYETACRQRDAVWALPDVATALSKGQSEVSAFWNDPDTGVLCRCRPDFVHEAGSGVVLLDLKTYSDASPHEFVRQVARKGYSRQCALYSDGYQLASGRKVLAFIFVCVEMSYPYAASAVMLDDESIEQGRRDYRSALNIYAECLKTNRWPGYGSAIELISLPAWAMEK